MSNLSKSQSFFLLGPRGSGKSTLLQEHFKGQKTLWIDLLEHRQYLQLSQNPDELLNWWQAKKPEWIIIDEVQKIPALLDVVHSGIEKNKIKFALTGSSARKLKRGGANLLAGRAVERQLFPLSSFELKDKFHLEKALSYGLLPKIWNEKLDASEAEDFLYSYVNTYLNEEIAAEQLVRNLDPFRRFLIAAAQMNGKIINHSAIERDSGVPNKQSQRHFEILADTLIGYFLHPFHYSARKRQTQKAKFYFFDTGVVRTLTKLASTPLESSSYEYGDLFETFIINEVIKLNSYLQKRWEFSYLRTTDDDREIDLIIEKPKGKNILVEIKSATKVKNEHLSYFSSIKKDIEHEKAYLLSNDKQEKVVDGIYCLHWQNGLKEIFDF